MIIHDLEQRSPEWFELRAGMPTASMFSKLITSKGDPSTSMKEYAYTLAGATYAGKDLDPWEGNKWTDRGTELEDAAGSLYEFSNGIEIQKIGFITDDGKTYGCSPDGLVDDDGMVEFKCLKAENHIKAIVNYQKNGKCPVTYIQQIQGQMMISCRDWCDIVFYHPELPLLIIRQYPDEHFMAELLSQIEQVLLERNTIVDALKDMQ